MENERFKNEEREIILQAEYRSLPPLERAVKLVNNHISSLQSAANTCHLSKSAVFRAVHAVEDGRPIGKCGNHYIFDIEHENELAAFIQSRSFNEALDYHQVHNMVK